MTDDTRLEIARMGGYLERLDSELVRLAELVAELGRQLAALQAIQAPTASQSGLGVFLGRFLRGLTGLR